MGSNLRLKEVDSGVPYHGTHGESPYTAKCEHSSAVIGNPYVWVTAENLSRMGLILALAMVPEQIMPGVQSQTFSADFNHFKPNILTLAVVVSGNEQ